MQRKPERVVSPGPGAPRAGARPRRFGTRRRLIATFSAMLAVFLAALGLQLVGLRRMESTFGAMKAHEQQMLLALQLEDEAREQYAHAAHFALGDATRLEAYDASRAHAAELMRVLSERVDEPDAIASLESIRTASAELDRIFREEVRPAVWNGRAGATLTLEKSYPLVSLIEREVDRIFGQLQQTTSAYRQELVAIEGRALRWTAALLVAAPLLVAGAVLYLSRSVARPLARLSDGAAALSRGDLDARIDVDTPDEFGALAADFNAMTVALKHHHERLVESEKLAGIGRLAAGVAHELNNPLQVMLGYLSLNRDVPDPRLAGQLAAVEEETLRCKHIVESMLELSRPAGTTSTVDLRSLCESVADRLIGCGSCANIRPSIDGEGRALADAQKVRQVLFNLVKNAAEAAGPTGAVGIAIADAGEMVEVTVRDSGPGLPPQARARLFEPFFTTKPAGTGLGLAVSRAIARAHGGDVDVRNGEAGGAEFTLRLPRASGGMEA